MWICRRCATHVQDDVLECPCCAMPAPARLQPELASHVSEEMRESPHAGQIHWLSLKTLPNIRKQAQSPWVWALFGLVFGLGCGTVNFHGSLDQPILCGVVLAVVFGMIGVILRRRRRLGPGHPYPAEIGAIIGFFLPIIAMVIDSFTNHRDWETPGELFGKLLLVSGGGAFLAAMLAIAFGGISAAWPIVARSLARRFARKRAPRKRPPRTALAKTDTLEQCSNADAETSDKIITAEEQVYSQLDKSFGIRRKDA